MGRRNPEETLCRWRDIISRWQASGQTKKDFCEANEIKYDLFSYYYTRLNKLEKKAITLTPVDVISSAIRYEIVFPSGLIIKVFYVEELTNIVNALKEYL